MTTSTAIICLGFVVALAAFGITAAIVQVREAIDALSGLIPYEDAE